MALYRIELLDENGSLRSEVKLDCETDDDAIKSAGRLDYPYVMQLYEADRLSPAFPDGLFGAAGDRFHERQIRRDSLESLRPPCNRYASRRLPLLTEASPVSTYGGAHLRRGLGRSLDRKHEVLVGGTAIGSARTQRHRH